MAEVKVKWSTILIVTAFIFAEGIALGLWLNFKDSADKVENDLQVLGETLP